MHSIKSYKLHTKILLEKEEGKNSTGHDLSLLLVELLVYFLENIYLGGRCSNSTEKLLS